MTSDPKHPGPGLYLVATPIGAARDITLRALDLLTHAQVLAAEDTRTLRHLMDIHGIPLGGRTLIAYHDHNGGAARPRILGLLAEGRSVAYASEAGTPLVADPGFDLVRAAAEAGHKVFAAPGASAVLAALTVSGLPSDRFLFAGFPPATSAARRRWLAELADTQATLILYESPKRIGGMLADCVQVFGGSRKAALCRELTKRFEEVVRDTLEGLASQMAARDLKGEIVLVIDRAVPQAADADTLNRALRDALVTLSVKDAAAQVAGALGMPRRDVYRAALRIGGTPDGR